MMDFSAIKNWHNEKILTKLKTKLEQKNFEVYILNNKEEIKNFINEKIPISDTVGLGGSVTLRELEIDSYIKSRGNVVYDHWGNNVSKEDIMKIIKMQPQSDSFLTSINAVTMNGQLVNIDTTGNRVSSMIFGPKQVIAFVGINKITKNLDEALWRIKNISSPQNSKRKELGAPCEKTGFCVECNSTASICKITTIIDYKPPTIKFILVLLPFQLGF